MDVRMFTTAAGQHGLVTVRQLLEIGMSRESVARRRRTGMLRAVRRGVFAVTSHPTTREQSLLAAVLAAGPTAALSHLSAAGLWGLVAPEPGMIEVTTVLERSPRLPGVRCHRSGLLVDLDRTRVRGVPVHSVERTAADLSGRLASDELGRLIDDAIRRRLTTYSRLWRVHERLPRAPGRSPRRFADVLLARTPGLADRESVLEDRVYEVIRAAGLPLPVPQFRITIGGRRRRIDFAYPDQRIAIEVDGYDVHRTRSAFDDDRARGNEIVLAGYRLLRFTSRSTDAEIVDQVRRAIHEFGENAGA
ncbi:MAG TPA: type IV toxin-antitoxin system AbiEi family antitoxin domain-containing protein [Acidimicrobiia bacterium]|nr:type IV toxin-antitoxin system AbiEi family antitoxin domain-containing protein [Acidimicrobiia bacterium]